MKAPSLYNLPAGFVFELTSLVGRLIGELAVDYGLAPNTENLTSIRKCMLNIAISLTVLDKTQTPESLKQEVNDVIDALDIKKLQEAFAVIAKEKNLPDYNNPSPPEPSTPKKDMN